ncbi:MAG: LOG family protein [Candidatus Omnitrophota bacterium]
MKKLQRSHYQMKEEPVNRLIDQLVRHVGGIADPHFLKEMIVTALKIGEEEFERGDVKMINTAMKELRYGIKVFYPYANMRKVAIFGSARIPRAAKEYQQASEFARLIVREGWMVITGAASGIMNAGNEGAGRANSFGVNIRLPFEQSANPVLAGDPKLIHFKYFFTRKLIFVAQSHATLLCPGGFGTHDEAFETMTLVQTGKTSPRPIVCLDPPRSTYWKHWREFLEKQMADRGLIDPCDIGLMDFTHDPKEAVEIIAGYYRNYHSMRYLGERLLLRLKRPLSRERILTLNRQFEDIILKGEIRQFRKPLKEEQEDHLTADLARLIFHFNRRHFARLHQMIKAVNAVSG